MKTLFIIWFIFFVLLCFWFAGNCANSDDDNNDFGV